MQNLVQNTLRWLPAIAIGLGLVIRMEYNAIWFIQPSLMFIMFATFLETRDEIWQHISRYHSMLLTFQLSFAAVVYLSLRMISPEIGAAGLMLVLAPTAVSAAAVAKGLDIPQGLVASSTLVTNLFTCITFPLVPMVVGYGEPNLASFLGPLSRIGVTIIVPFLLASLLARVTDQEITWFRSSLWKWLVRFIWSAILFVSASKVGLWYTTNTQLSGMSYIWPPLLAIVIFIIQALVGYYARKDRRIESLLSFAHMNSGIAILLVIDIFPASTIAAILAYALVQNVYFSVLMGRKTTN